MEEQDARQDANCNKVDGPTDSQSGQHRVHIFSSFFAWSDARYVTSMALHLFGYFDRIESHRRVEEGKEENTVLEVFEKGYRYKDRVIRHAKVVVNQTAS